MTSLTIVPAVPSDAAAISAMITGFAADLTVNPDGSGAEQFLQYMTAGAIESYIKSADIDYRKAMVDHRLAGVVALRDGHHLYHLFVAREFQRRGIATALWHTVRALASSSKKGITVNSSLLAIPVYERFGFRATGPKIEKDGVAFVPMHWHHGIKK
jgi:GNAT superfamily N-acetyltransferase